jgi:hypothetical protein
MKLLSRCCSVEPADRCHEKLGGLECSSGLDLLIFSFSLSVAHHDPQLLSTRNSWILTAFVAVRWGLLHYAEIDGAVNQDQSLNSLTFLSLWRNIYLQL